MDLFEANCRVAQAQAVLGTWLETCGEGVEANLVAAALTVLEGVEQVLNAELEKQSMK